MKAIDLSERERRGGLAWRVEQCCRLPGPYVTTGPAVMGRLGGGYGWSVVCVLVCELCVWGEGVVMEWQVCNPLLCNGVVIKQRLSPLPLPPTHAHTQTHSHTHTNTHAHTSLCVPGSMENG